MTNEGIRGKNLDVLKSSAKRAFDSLNLGNIVEIKPLGNGEINTLFSIQREGHKREVLRLAPKDSDRANILEMTKIVASKAIEAGINTPRIKYVSQSDSSLGNFSIEEFVNANEVKSSDNFKTELPKIFHVIDKIHTIRMNGWGNLDRNGKGNSPDWQSAVINEQRNALKGIYGRGIDKIVGRTLLDSIGKGLAQTSLHIPNMNRLLHGDLKLPNMLKSDDNDIVVVDWESAMSGDPIYDLAYWGIVEENLAVDAKDWGSFDIESIGDFIENRYLHYQGTVLLKMIYWAGKTNNNDSLKYFGDKAKLLFSKFN